jgi:hypothetical protein
MEYEIEYLCEKSIVELLCFSFSSPVAIIFCCSYYFFFRPILNLVNLDKEIYFPLKSKMIKQVSNPLYNMSTLDFIQSNWEVGKNLPRKKNIM